MNTKILVLAILFIALALLVTAAIIFPPGNLFAQNPEEVVRDFYDWYISYESNPLVDRIYQTNQHLTSEFIQNLNKFTASGMGFDPILCAQDEPESFETSKATILGDVATVPVATSFEDHNFLVELRHSDQRWMINNVICNP